MHCEKAFIFDLDGTLTQSEEGIWNCVCYAMEKMGREKPDAATLRRFIGPPLQWSFENLCGMTTAQAQEATEKYRERYTTVGLLENRVYPGVRELLRLLKRQGAYVAVATGKPQEPSERILAHFRLDKYVDAVAGPRAGENHPEKDALIRRVLPEHCAEATMVGDRCFDVAGGKAVGIRTVGVGYGYGTEEELRGAGCDAYAATVAELTALLCPGAEPLPGAFLSMEGLDGSGKGTQLARLVDGLDRYGYRVRLTREPGGCPIAEKLREIVLGRENSEMTAMTEALIYASARSQHVTEVIRPALARGELVLSDRFVDSSVAYQGGGRQLGVQRVLALNAPAVDGTMPCGTVFLDLPHEVALARRCAVSEPDRIEVEAESFHARVEAGYRELIAGDPERFLAVDASRDVETIAAEVLEKVLDRLAEVEG